MPKLTINLQTNQTPYCGAIFTVLYLKTLPVRFFGPMYHAAHLLQICQCRRDEQYEGQDQYCCGDDCLNRTSHYLCDARACPCRGDCRNKQFNLRQAPAVEVRLTENR